MDSGARYLPLKPVIEGQVSRPDIRQQTSEVGFPIRKSADQSLFAAPHGLSQRITSFIACACQGIHRTPLLHLIALIFDARHSRTALKKSARSERGTDGILEDPRSQTRTGPPISPRTAIWAQTARRADGSAWKDQCHTRFVRRRGGQASPAFAHPAGQNPRNVRTTLLFTMSANRQRAANGHAAILDLLSTSAGKPKAGWWSQTGSNRRPHACKARALPTELWPLGGPSGPSEWGAADGE